MRAGSQQLMARSPAGDAESRFPATDDAGEGAARRLVCAPAVHPAKVPAAARGKARHGPTAATPAMGNFKVVERTLFVSSRMYEGRARPASPTRSTAAALKPALASAAAFASCSVVYAVHIQAYRLKKPGNFVQLFLSNGMCYTKSESRFPTRICLERVPHQVFFAKSVGVAKSTFSPRKSHFLAGGKSLISLRVKRVFYKILAAQCCNGT